MEYLGILAFRFDRLHFSANPLLESFDILWNILESLHFSLVGYILDQTPFMNHLEFFGIFWNFSLWLHINSKPFLESFGIFWNFLEFQPFSLVDYIVSQTSFRNPLKFFGISWNLSLLR